MNESKGLVLITGASSGLGEQFSKKLAASGYNLILVARDEAKLANLSKSLQQQYKVKVDIIKLDLTCFDETSQLEMHIRQIKDLSMLINCAGFITTKPFAKTAIERQLDMISLHNATTVRLTHAALPNMIKNNAGTIINIASMVAYMTEPEMAVYAASKAFLIPFSRILQKELKNTGIKIQALCPGLMRTAFFSTTEYKDIDIFKKYPPMLWMDADKVADVSLRALNKRKVVVVPGLKNKIYVLLLKIADLFC